MFYIALFILCPTTGQVRHKALFKVGPNAGPQPIHVWQNLKIPLALSAPTKTPGNKQQTIVLYKMEYLARTFS